jgi:GNAT superfamily N-acetyltransferase
MWGADLTVNAAYLEWKHFDNPYVDRPILYLALCQDQVVGMRGMFGTRWQIGRPRQLLNCVSDADAVIHPAHRRRGLLERMTQLTLDDLASSAYEYVVTLSANQFSGANNLKLGWRNVGLLEAAHWYPKRRQGSRFRRFVRQLPILPSLYRRLRRHEDGISPGTRSPFDTLDENGDRVRREKGVPVAIASAPRPEAMAELHDRIDSGERLHHVRDPQFFAWRFRNPLSTYRFLFWEESKLEGYLVLQTRADQSDNGWVTIVDWEASSLKVRADLLRAATERGNFGVLAAWTATLPNSARNLLGECGFSVLGRAEDAVYQKSLLMRTTRPSLMQADWTFANRRLLDMSNWDLRAIDSDDF